MSRRHVETLFCDDIRQEVANKISFIGAYSSSLLVHDFPIVLPKLCLAVKVIAPADEPINSMKLRVLQNDDTLQEIDFDKQQLTAASDAAEDDGDMPLRGRKQVTQFMLVFSPIRFDSACNLKVRVEADGEVLRGIGLKVDRAPRVT